MKLTSVTGHMMEIEFDKAYQSWNSCQPIELFHAPINKTVKKESINIQKTLSEEAKKCNVLLLWLDCDLEGENICFEVMQVCLEANPRLDVYRARFSALIPRDIMRTLQYPERPNNFFNEAVEARQEIDLRLGAAFTRFQTLRVQRKFDNIGHSVISYGPCQFPTLGFVVDRYLRIKEFIPEDFWSIQCDYEVNDPDEKSGKLLTNFSWDRGRLFDRFSCTVLYEACFESPVVGGLPPGRARVTKVDQRPATRQRPVPLNTVELQMRASRFLHFGSEKTMQIAESLYQRGLLSYPRTETDFFKEGFELQPLLEEHRAHPAWGGFAAALLDEPGKFQWPRKGSHDDQAHPPIHPAKCVDPAGLPDTDERALYELVAMHFLACCATDAVGSQTTVSICIPAEGVDPVCCEGFSASGLVVLERNWLEVYSKYEKWIAKKVPRLTVGDIFLPRSLCMTSGRTAAPPPISESDLISEMDRNGIGTDATIATHISTIQQRDYASKDPDGRFIPTALGLALVDAYNSMGFQLNKPHLRASMEADCQRVARGELPRIEAVQNCLRQMKECFTVCQRDAAKLDAAMAKHFPPFGTGGSEADYVVSQRNLSTCGSCHDGMDLRERRDGQGGRQLFCRTCQRAYQLPPNGSLAQHEASCPICGFQVLVVTNPTTQREHTICPYCFRNPPPEHQSVEEAGNDFRCFTCSHNTCPLAGGVVGGDSDVSGCPDALCGGRMRLRRTGKGGADKQRLCLACARKECTRVWWFPRCVKTVEPLPATSCVPCSRRRPAEGPVLLLRITFSLGQAPPGTPPELDVCVCCSDIWRHLDFAPLSLALPPPPPLATAASRPPQDIQMDYGRMEYGRPAAVAPPSGMSDYGAALQGRGGRGGRQGRPAGRGRATTTAPAALVPDAPQCGCGSTCRVQTVSKEGPNKGRQFFTCSKPREQQCKFFEWFSEGTAVAAAASARPGFVCSICRGDGHSARSCPNKQTYK